MTLKHLLAGRATADGKLQQQRQRRERAGSNPSDQDERNDDVMIFSGEHTRLSQLLLANDLPAKAWTTSHAMATIPPRVRVTK